MLNALLFAALFGGEPNDAIVTLSSQSGGLPGSAVTHFSQIQHSDANKNDDVTARVKDLLLANPNSSLLTKEPFKQITQTYNSQPRNLEAVEFKDIQIEISSPPSEEKYYAGDELTVTATAPTEVSTLLVQFENTPDGDYESQHIEGHQGTFTFTINETPLGNRKILTRGFSDKGTVAASFRDIFVDVKEKPYELSIQPTRRRMKVGERHTIEIRGYFSDFSTSINELPGTTYRFSNGKVRHIGNNVIEAVEPGEVEMIVNFRGVDSKPILIEVTEPDTSTSTHEPGGNKEQTRLKVYPTITHAMLNLEFLSKQASSVHIAVTDLLGKNRFSESYKFWQGINRETLDLSFLNRGAYFITLFEEGKRYTAKFFKH